MSDPALQAWLAALQARFSDAIRAPLERTTGTLRARDRYAAEVSNDLRGHAAHAHDGLAVYNRQYWFRLFGVLQSEYRLTARVFGMWHFNAWAQRFLQDAPPRSYDVHDIAEAFVPFLERALPDGGVPTGAAPLPRATLLACARIDAAFRATFFAPVVPALDPTTLRGDVLGVTQLVPCPAWTLLDETWPLLELRQELLHDSGEDAVAFPGPHEGGPRCWLVCRTETGAAALPVPAGQARLYSLLREKPIGAALATLEREQPTNEVARLAKCVQAWLAESMHLSLWTRAVTTSVPEGEAP